MRILRSGPIGSISAWLPSRRSTLHQVGALVMVLPGQDRSGRLIGSNGRYFSNGIVFAIYFLLLRSARHLLKAGGLS